MGKVYRARDPKLNHEVAADYLARFQREAQTLAAPNHPNIASSAALKPTS